MTYMLHLFQLHLAEQISEFQRIELCPSGRPWLSWQRLADVATGVLACRAALQQETP